MYVTNQLHGLVLYGGIMHFSFIVYIAYTVKHKLYVSHAKAFYFLFVACLSPIFGIFFGFPNHFQDI